MSLIKTFFLFLLVAIPAIADIAVTDLLDDSSRTTKMVLFQQSASSGVDSTSVSKITLAYFTSADCSASAGTSVPHYTTPDGTSFTISVGSSFGMVAASAWNVGNSKVSPAVADMTTIQSIAVTFKSTNSSTPQAAFTNGSAEVISYACVPVTCSGGECTSGSGTQSFTLKTTAAVGDPAEGGIIGCQNTGTSFNLFDIVVANSNHSVTIAWGGSGTVTGATSTTDGAGNTATVVACLTGPGGGGGCPENIGVSTYAAGICSSLTATGGYTSNWFLPSGNGTNTQINCLYNNRTAIGVGAVAAGGAAFLAAQYFSSTEATSANAYRFNFSAGTGASTIKTGANRVRCVRSF